MEYKVYVILITILTNNTYLNGDGDWGLGIAIPNPQSPIPINIIKLLIYNS